ncbi:MAG: ROK family protein [Candidatus Omnitrophica bacterium]|nr:ROK family protein [Candidatus Omnitrophota bacterium]HOX55014.1 ROK family protein [Candidatus Omnitrophota bacterium]
MRPLNIRGESLSERERKNLAILEAIRRSGPISKTDISSLAGLNVVTVTNYVDNFLKSRLVFEKELDVSAGGRRPVLLDLNSRAHLAIGVGLNLSSMVGVITDLSGNVVYKTKRERSDVPVKEIVDSVIDIIRELIDKNASELSKIRGVGIGIAGIVNHKGDTIRWPEKVSSKDCIYTSMYLPLKEIIEKEFSIPCIVENDATVACFAEQWLSLEPEIEDVIYMFSGVGCGIMINRQIYRGFSGGAGEVSIDNTKENNLFNCSFASPCFLKRWDADLGLVEEAKKKLSGRNNISPSSKILELSDNDVKNIKLANIFQAARENDAMAVDLIRQAAKRLGIKIAYLVNLLNPEVVIIGGGIEEAGSVFLDTVKQTVSDWAFDEMASNLKIIPSKLKENSVALGAASLVVRQVFAQS